MTIENVRPKHLVIFQPSGRQAYVEEGITLLEAARQLGVGIESTCGGRMTCSKCRVEIQEGCFEAFGIESGMHHLSPPDAAEREFYAVEGFDARTSRQSCAARVLGPVVVFVPESSRAVRQTVRKGARDLVVEIKPAVRKYYVEMIPPTIRNPLGDWERLQGALADQHGLHDLKIDHQTLLELPGLLRKAVWRVTVAVWRDHEVIRVEPGLVEPTLGVAIDVGTTTLAAYLCDLRTGKLLATEAMMNPQTAYGDDVMVRISFTMTDKDGLERLHRVILDGLNTMIERITKKVGCQPTDILETVLVGNTCMHHLCLNIDPRYVGLAPFTPAVHGSLSVKADAFGLKTHPSANVHILPIEAGFVGADNVGCLVAEQPYKQDEIVLLIDIGTNGEMVLGNRHKLLACSCATGPAFEGAQITFGMRASEGAIEKIEIDPRSWDVRYKVIGREEWSDQLDRSEIQARGLCGSAIIDLGWELFKSGVVDETGRFSRDVHSPRLREGSKGREFVIAWADETAIGRDITFNTDDVRALQLAKAAMYCGAKVMMRRLGVDKLDQVILAGAFGSYIDKVKAMAAGLFPDCDLTRTFSVGNAAGDGARMCLLNTDLRAEADAVARKVEYVELSLEPDFDRLFAAALNFPHAHDEFPHLYRLFERARCDGNARVLINTSPFQMLPSAQLEKVASAAQEQQFRKRKMIVQAGDCAAGLYLVREGQVNLIGPQGQVVDELKPGALLGGEELLNQRAFQMTAVSAAPDTRLLVIPAQVLLQALETAPDVADSLRAKSEGKLHGVP